MSWHLSNRFTPVHRAVSTALLYSIGYVALSTSAQAATLGKTVITSAQHEPLAASIMVTDIKAAEFSATLADADIYQQMGLTPTNSMNVSFRQTSATSGEVFISTTQPVSKPFADVVLAITESGQRLVIPKTLLMPLDSIVPVKPTNQIANGVKKPNLPVVTASDVKPLTLRQGMPPPLRLAPDSQMPNTAASANSPMSTASPYANDGLNANTNASTISVGNKQLDILNIQITRQIRSSGDTSMLASAPSPMMPLPLDNMPANSDFDTDDSNTDILATINSPAAKKPSTQLPYNNRTQPVAASTNKNASGTAPANTTKRSNVNYTVQRNDNLWIISQQIAKQNKLDVQTVMAEIKRQNPDAFINQNANQLKADAQLNLPNYNTLPSQQSLKAAINAQRQHAQSTTRPPVKKPTENKPVQKPASAADKQAANTVKKPATATQKLPEARFSVLAPGRNGTADGTQTQTSSKTGNGLSTDILATLKSSRQRTAEQAEQLSKTSTMLGNYTKKLQLQNQKLAELQARLKQLRNQ